MSENLDLVRSIYADWERGDYSSTEWADPEIEYVIVGGPEPGRWTGLAGMSEGWGDWLRAWADFRTEAEEYREIDDERVLVLAHHRGRGKTSGLGVGEIGNQVASCFNFRRGKVTRLAIYHDRALALSDLGLEE